MPPCWCAYRKALRTLRPAKRSVCALAGDQARRPAARGFAITRAARIPGAVIVWKDVFSRQPLRELEGTSGRDAARRVACRLGSGRLAEHHAGDDQDECP